MSATDTEKERGMQRGTLIADNLPESLLSNDSLFGACRRLRSAYKTHRFRLVRHNLYYSHIITMFKISTISVNSDCNCRPTLLPLETGLYELSDKL